MAAGLWRLQLGVNEIKAFEVSYFPNSPCCFLPFPCDWVRAEEGPSRCCQEAQLWVLSQLEELKPVPELQGGCRGREGEAVGTGKMDGSTVLLGSLHLVLFPPQ